MFRNKLEAKILLIIMIANLMPSQAIADCDTSHWSHFEWPPYTKVVADKNVRAVESTMEDYLHQTSLGNSLWYQYLFVDQSTRDNLSRQFNADIPPALPYDPTSHDFARLICKSKTGKYCGFFSGKENESFFTGESATVIRGYRILNTKLVDKLGSMDRAVVTVEFDVVGETQGLGLPEWKIIPVAEKETLSYEWIRVTDYAFSDELTKSYWFLLSNHPIHVSIDSFRNYFEMETCRLKDMEKGTWEESEIYERLKNNLASLRAIEGRSAATKSANRNNPK